MMVVAPRIMTLDLIRGVAVMGILAANIVGFGFPEFAYMTPAALGPPSLADMIAWATTFIVIDGKMRGLFSFLFGASMLLVVDRADANGEGGASLHYTRMAWLFLFGLAHLYLIWWGDILAHYALVGSIAYLFARLSVRTLAGLGLLCIAVQTIEAIELARSMFQLHTAALAPGASARLIADYTAIAGDLGRPAAADIAAEFVAGRGSYVGLLHWRWTHDPGPLTILWQLGAETLGYMLLGMAGLRSGFLTGTWSRRRYAIIAAVTIGIGWPIYAGMAAMLIGHGFDPRYVLLAGLTLTTPIRPLLIVGYAACIILLARAGGPLTARIAAAGRMAFSNYLGTSLICTTLFYGYGLGLYGHVPRAHLYGIVIAIWLLMLVWSKPWLERYSYGPLEWLWRSLSRFAWQPMRQALVAPK